MDEPFGALDEIVRDHLNSELLKLWAATQKTIAFVTHSIPEAVYLSTKIVVMSPRPGRVTDIIESTCRRAAARIRETPEFLAIAHRVRDGLRAGHSYEESDAGETMRTRDCSCAGMGLATAPGSPSRQLRGKGTVCRGTGWRRLRW